MSDSTRATERLVSDWLDDMRHPRPPDYVVDAVLGSIPSTRQDSADAVARRAPAVRAGRPGRGRRDRDGRRRAGGAGPSRGTRSARCFALPHANAVAPGRRSVAAAGVTAIDMGRETWSLTVDEASVWVQDQDNIIRRIDRATNTVGGRVPWDVPHMQLEDGQLWALSGGTSIIRVDPLTGQVLQEFTGVSGFNIAVDGTTAWVSDAGHTVDRVDLETGEIVASVDVPPGPGELIVFEGDVWVACDEGGVVARIDGDTNTVIATIDAGWRPVNLAGGEGAVWVRNYDTRLLRIDPATNTVVATVVTRNEGVAGPPDTGVAVGGGSAWIVVSNGIGRVDPATNEIVQVIPIGGGGYVDLVWFDGELWASSTDRNLVFRMEITP